MNVREVISRYCVNVSHTGLGEVHFGSTRGMDCFDFEKQLPRNFVEMSEWADRDVRRVWVCPTERVIISWASGEIQVLACPDEARYRHALSSYNTYYTVMA